MMGPMLCSIVLAVTLTTTEQTPKQDFQGHSRELKVGSEGNAVRVCMDFSGHCKSSEKILLKCCAQSCQSLLQCVLIYMYCEVNGKNTEWSWLSLSVFIVPAALCCVLNREHFVVFVTHFVSDHWDNGLRCFCFLLLLVGFFHFEIFQCFMSSQILTPHNPPELFYLHQEGFVFGSSGLRASVCVCHSLVNAIARKVLNVFW